MKKKVEVSFVNVMETAKSGSEPRTSGNSHHRNVCVCVCVVRMCVCVIDVPSHSQNEWFLNIPVCSWMRQKMLIFSGPQKNREHSLERLTMCLCVPHLSDMNTNRNLTHTQWPVFVKPVFNIGPPEVVTPSLSSAMLMVRYCKVWRKLP